MTAVAIGVDVGSTTWKAVAIDGKGRIVARSLEKTHPRMAEQTERGLAALREESRAPKDMPVGATGYGRKRVTAAKTLTEITCHAMGAFHLVKSPLILIDVGGQDSKVIRIGHGGEVIDFAMNDKCAAGTGRFLEVIFDRLHVSWDDVESLVARAEKIVSVSSTCTVFAESEVVSLMAEGESVEGILKGVHLSLTSRLATLIGAVSDGVPIYMSGGVAKNRAMVDALALKLGKTVNVLPDAQFIGALGAALAVR